ncbi:NAD-dependent epimerase/dehydratase family protein [Candidatus Woesearchaeota archaeon]|nr:NAD-dependent epimerase/dehydratase family protein [Candidatus Woesearchaeota archaeon]
MNTIEYIKTSKDREDSYNRNGLTLETIFARRDSQPKNESRNLLNHIVKFSFATLSPKKLTTTASYNEQEIFYVVKGEGVIITGERRLKIGKDYAFIIPPKVDYAISNTSEENLEILVITEEAPKNSKNEITIKDTNKIPFDNFDPLLHWCHHSKTIFSFEKDNLTKTHYISLVYVDGEKLPEPHPHFNGHDEVWHALEGKTIMAFKDNLMCTQIPGTSILIPDNGQIPHTSINPFKETAKFFFFMHHMGLDNRILITGSRGTIGSIIAKHLKENGYQFITELDKDNPENPVDLLKDDITHYFKNIDSVIHLAANSNPFIKKEEADKNVEIAKKVIGACKDSGIKRIINASSINVYPYASLFKKGEKLTNQTSFSPNTIFYPCITGGYYGEAKIKTEFLLRGFCKENGVYLINLRIGCLMKNNLPSVQEDGVVDPVDFDIFLKHEDLIKIIEKSLNHNGNYDYVCVSKKDGFVDNSIRFPL